jgi:hypothetical protein
MWAQRGVNTEAHELRERGHHLADAIAGNAHLQAKLDKSTFHTHTHTHSVQATVHTKCENKDVWSCSLNQGLGCNAGVALMTIQVRGGKGGAVDVYLVYQECHRGAQVALNAQPKDLRKLL